MLSKIVGPLLALLLLAGCLGVDGAPLALTGGEQASPQTQDSGDSVPPESSSAAQSSSLLAALAASPAQVQDLFFTDWAAVHEAMGLDPRHAAITDEWMLALSREQVTATAYAGFYQRQHAEEWGWDALDQEWEALLSVGDLPPIYVLKLHPEFDVSPVLDHFTARGFTRQEYRGVPVYSHPMDLSQDWIRSTELSVLNTAVLEDKHLLILSSSLDGVTTVLDARADGTTLLENDGARAVMQRLTGASAVAMLPGPDACLSFTPNPLVDAIGKGEISPQDLEGESLPAQPQAIYMALGLGYRYPGAGIAGEDAARVDAVDAPHWLAVMHYVSPELAAQDLAPRLALARKGLLRQGDRPFAELVRVVAAMVAGPDLLLAMVPEADIQQSVLLRMLMNRDLLFATCP